MLNAIRQSLPFSGLPFFALAMLALIPGNAQACVQVPANPPDITITGDPCADGFLTVTLHDYSTFAASNDFCACALNLPLLIGQVIAAEIIDTSTGLPVSQFDFTSNQSSVFGGSPHWQGFSSAVSSVVGGLAVDLRFRVVPSKKTPCQDLAADVVGALENPTGPGVAGTAGADEMGVPNHHIGIVSAGHITIGEGCEDVDGDGVARCCELGPFFAKHGDNPQEIFAYMSNANGTFTPSPTPIAVLPSSSIALSSVGDFNSNQRYDVLWYDSSSLERFLTECDQEWQTTGVGAWTYPSHFGGGDFDGDNDTDLVTWDLSCCPMAGPVLGSGIPALGISSLGDGTGFFTENYGDWDPAVVLNAWIGIRTYNQLDTGAGTGSFPDLLFMEYATGGASTTEVHQVAGNGDGTFQASTLIGTVPDQPQNFGDVGDISGDGCADWVGGPDDDGDRGSVFAMLGDCAGSFGSAVELVDVCDGCPGSGSGQGSGRSQLYDWDLDGDLDLLTGHTVDTGSSGEILYWENDGTGTYSGPTTIVPASDQINNVFVSPLQSVEVTCPDIDGDGVARCCTPGPFFTTYDSNFQGIQAHMSNGDGTFTPSPTLMAEVDRGQLRWNGVSDFDRDGMFDLLWYKTDSRERFLTECHHEWITTPVGDWTYPGYNNGGDLNGDGFADDLVTWDMSCCTMSGPVEGPGTPALGQTALNTPLLVFSELYGTWDPSAVAGAWIGQRVHNLQDANSDGHADVIFLEYATGGASTSELYLAEGLGNGNFLPPQPIGTVPGQPQNQGDMGDIDGDGRVDWVGGPDDDGDKGIVKALLGFGNGSFGGPIDLVDACPGSCPGSGSAHGTGASQLYDWDGDQDLDLLTVHVVDTDVSATVLYWENLGSGTTFAPPVTVVAPSDLTSSTIASPFRPLAPPSSPNLVKETATSGRRTQSHCRCLRLQWPIS